MKEFKMIDYIKIGFGFYIGYNLAGVIDTTFGIITKKKSK